MVPKKVEIIIVEAHKMRHQPRRSTQVLGSVHIAGTSHRVRTMGTIRYPDDQSLHWITPERLTGPRRDVVW